MPPNAFDQLSDLGRIAFAHSGHGGPRDHVNEPGGMIGDQFDPLVGRSRRDQKDRVETGAAHPGDKIFGLFGNQISHQHAVDAHPLQFGADVGGGKLHQWVEVGEEQDRDVAALAYAFDDGQNVGDAYRFFQRALRSPLNHRPIRHWVGERDAEFDHVRASIGQREQQAFGRRQVWITSGDVGDEGFAAFTFQSFKFYCNTSHERIGKSSANCPVCARPSLANSSPVAQTIHPACFFRMSLIRKRRKLDSLRYSCRSIYFFPLYVTLQTFFPPSSTTSNDPSRIILTPTGRPHTSWPDSSGTQPVRKFS